MAQSSVPLTSLTEAQRAQAVTRFTIIRPALEDGITQAQVARTHNIPAPTVRRWMKHYRDKGLAGLADAASRSDKGKSRRLPPDAIALIEGLALQKPRRSMAVIHRQVVTIAEKQGWKPPSYDRVRQIIQNIDPALVTLAHEGAAVYREEFDLLYRREATHSNAIWQADHTPLDMSQTSPVWTFLARRSGGAIYRSPPRRAPITARAGEAAGTRGTTELAC